MTKGVVAAGSVPTAEAGAEVLRRGGNAVDAAVGACFATAAGEPSLTSLAGGGMMMHRDGATGEVTVCDFFSDAPRTDPESVADFDFTAVDLDFGPTTQRFYIGAGSAAVPGVLPGLCEALERWGRLPLTEVVAPACRCLREGIVFGDNQGRAIKLLEPILTFSEAGRAAYTIDGRLVGAGDRFTLPAVADTLEAMARGGGRRWYDEVVGAAILGQFSPAAGGLITAEDLNRFDVHFREPLRLRYHHQDVAVPPPPAAGGTMIAMMLALLSEVEAAPFGSPERIRQLADAMAIADEARSEGLHALNLDRLAHWRDHFELRLRQPRLLRSGAALDHGPGNTTHISVIDEYGNAAAITFSYGEGNGYLIGDTGIMMNNLMGEEDLLPDGLAAAPRGQRLPTMMSPCVITGRDGDITAMGTGGANRIRTAVVQTVANIVDHGMSAERAVAAPRIHFEAGVLNAETYGESDAVAADALAVAGADALVTFDRPTLFFGGVHLVRRTPDGAITGAGDHRRGGTVREVG